MLRHLGYVAIALSINATTNRTCRLRNATPQRLRELIQANLADLYRVLEYNVQQRIFLYRISSQLIPFASHPVNTLAWWEEETEQLARLGQFIQQHGLRVSMHPGQFTVLNSPEPAIVTAAVAELAWHVRLLDALQTDDTHKIVIHVGGAYGSQAAATDRFVATVARLPDSWRRRLVIENDERSFATDDVLAIARRTGLPVVFDWLHHRANPGRRADIGALVAECFATWRATDGPPKVHLSSQAPGGRPGQHADWVEPADCAALLRLAPPSPFDCMLEAKQKDRALMRLRSELRRRNIVEAASALPSVAPSSRTEAMP